MLAEEQERSYKGYITKLLNNLKATEADKEKLETELAGEIGAFAQLTGDYNWFKKESKKEAGRVARELKLTQESLLDANNKATNEKTELLKELKAINVLLKGTDTDKDALNKQIESIKNRLNEILNIEGRDVETVKEKRQAEHLDALKEKDLILTEEEKKALDYAAGYFYWHSKGNHTAAKKDKETLEQYLKDNTAKIVNSSVLFSVNVVIEHFNEEEQHNEDNHKYLKDLSDLNNKYTDLDAKYKDKEAELIDAQEKLKLTQEEKDKISDAAIKKIGFLEKDIKDLSEINNENYKKWTEKKAKLIKEIDELRQKLEQKTITEADFLSKIETIQKQLDELNAEARMSTTEKIQKLAMTDTQLSNFGNDIWENLTKTLTELESTQSKKRQKEHAERFKKWLSSFEAEYKNIFEALGTGERERERALIKVRIEWANDRLKDPSKRHAWETEEGLKKWLAQLQQELIDLDKKPESSK